MALAAYEATWIVLETLEPVVSRGEPTRARLSEVLIGAERKGLLGHVSFDEREDWASESLYWYHIGPQGVPSL